MFFSDEIYSIEFYLKNESFAIIINNFQIFMKIVKNYTHEIKIINCFLHVIK
jgi:hypothetical protein